MTGLIGKKVGMTSIFDDDGDSHACTVIEVGPCVVVQLRTQERDGYEAVQLGFGEATEKSTSNALLGHFERAGTAPKKELAEFQPTGDEDLALGDEIRVEDVFEEGQLVRVAGISKGKGTQGVVKRHGFSGVGMATHGQKDRERAPGSIGQASDPSRVFKGVKMPGRTGNQRVTVSNLEVKRILPDQNVLLVNGSVPGGKGNFVEIRHAAD